MAQSGTAPVLSGRQQPQRQLRRYDAVAILLHWLIGVALIAEIAFGFLLDGIAARGTPARAGVVNLHKSIGIVLGVLVVARIVWRLRHAAPPWPASMPTWHSRLADLGHEAMYVCMLVVPLSGYIASNFSKYGVTFFGTRLPPWGAELPDVYRLFNGLHDVSSWVLCALIVVHVVAALKHAWIDRDGVFSRIWPGPR